MSYGCIFADVTIKTWSPLAKTINLGEIFTQSFAVLGTVVLTRHLRFSSSSLRACERLLHSFPAGLAVRSGQALVSDGE